ncbi:MAG: Mur ligase family protein [Bacteroidota bacterium]
MKNVHFIAIGGAVMHNLAIALYKMSYNVTGSDDEIFEPSKSRLLKYGLLPGKQGWFAEKITEKTDAVILGMHAHSDNPELVRARELSIPVYSFPEYLFEQTKDKKRVVIGGSHGKTTTTSMIMHVLKENNIKFDYMVGAQIEGFDTMVQLSDAPLAIFEGDEYLSSTLDMRPKFHLYKPHIAVITGIAWDHINVFPTFENYIEQFEKFIDLIEKNGTLIYYQKDNTLSRIVNQAREELNKIPYIEPSNRIIDGKTNLVYNNKNYSLSVFGDHNLQNISAAKEVCNLLGISNNQFYNAIGSFKGASKRLQLLAENEFTAVFLDFAHSPSKLKATTEAVKKQYKERRLVACMELHTYSSLKEEFLPHYHMCMQSADIAYVYFNPETIKHKRLKNISKEKVAKAFGIENIQVFTDRDQLINNLMKTDWNNTNLLLMSSGNFSGVDFQELANKIMG